VLPTKAGDRIVGLANRMKASSTPDECERSTWAPTGFFTIGDTAMQLLPDGVLVDMEFREVYSPVLQRLVQLQGMRGGEMSDFVFRLWIQELEPSQEGG